MPDTAPMKAATPKARRPATAVGMPTRRAPSRLTEQARSALPISVSRKNQPSAGHQRDGDAEDAQALAADEQRADGETLGPQRRRVRPLRPEEGEAEPGQRDMHAEGDDQQRQHARLRQAVEGEIIKDDAERDDQRQREDDVHRETES